MSTPDTIIPSRLRPGLTVGTCSPSKAVTPDVRDRFYAGLRVIEWFSVHTKVSEHAEAATESEVSVEERLNDFHDLVRDPDIKMIAFARVGDSAHELLPKIDFDLIARNPKIIAGRGDATVLLNAINARTGLVTYHASDVVEGLAGPFSREIRDNYADTFFAGLNVPLLQPKRWQHFAHKDIPAPGWRVHAAGRATGRLVGGNLTSFERLVQAGGAPSLSGAILFVEDSVTQERDLASIEQGFERLDARGTFEGVRGVVLGWFDAPRDQIEAVGDRLTNLFIKRFAPSGAPILQITELGQNVENYAFPIGIDATIDTNNRSITLERGPTAEADW